MTEPTPRARRPHPARRARRLTAAGSLVAALGLGGWMATQAHAGTATVPDPNGSSTGSASTDDGSSVGSDSGWSRDWSFDAPSDWSSGSSGSSSSGSSSSGSSSSGSGAVVPDSSSHAS